MAVERECKIPVPDLTPLADRLRRLGASPFAPRRREHNLVFDTPDDALARSGKVLRLRTHENEPGGVVTVKTPLRDGAFKAREEIETRIEDPDAARRQWLALGFNRVRIYDKDREEWSWRGGRVALDRCPEIGCFVEVEGNEETIRAVLADLGVDPAGHTPKNYLLLWREHLDRLGEPDWRDMVF